MKDNNVYILQILDAISKIESFTLNMNKDAFKNDQKTQSAVIMQLLLIGEVSKKVNVETKDKIDLPWRDIAGFGDKAIHDYFSMDLNLVWETVMADIPNLKSKISAFEAF